MCCSKHTLQVARRSVKFHWHEIRELPTWFTCIHMIHDSPSPRMALCSSSKQLGQLKNQTVGRGTYGSSEFFNVGPESFHSQILKNAGRTIREPWGFMLGYPHSPNNSKWRCVSWIPYTTKKLKITSPGHWNSGATAPKKWLKTHHHTQYHTNTNHIFVRLCG